MLVGMNLTSIRAYTKDQPFPKVNVNSAPKVVDVEEFPVADMKDVLRIKFGFVCEYSPDVGKVEIEGSVLWKDANAKDILKSWKDERKISTKVAAPILNAVFRKCLTKTIELSEELRLPPPVQFPVVVEGKPSPKEKKSAAA